MNRFKWNNEVLCPSQDYICISLISRLFINVGGNNLASASELLNFLAIEPVPNRIRN